MQTVSLSIQIKVPREQDNKAVILKLLSNKKESLKHSNEVAKSFEV